MAHNRAKTADGQGRKTSGVPETHTAVIEQSVGVMESCSRMAQDGRDPQDEGGKTPRAFVVVLNYQAAEMTMECVRSVLNIEYPNLRLLVVDNASTDDSVTQLRTALTDPNVELLVNGRNEGYAGGNNRGIEKALSAGADYIFVLNNDTIAEPGCISSLVEAMERHPKIGVCGCRIVDIGQESSPVLGQGVSLFTGKTRRWVHPGAINGPVDVDFICGAAIMFRAETLRQIGMFDSRFFLLCEDSDICFRARKAGYRVCFVPGPGVRHRTAQSLKHARRMMAFLGPRNKVWFVRRHGALKHRLVFDFLHFFFIYPKQILGQLVRGQFELLGPFFRGIWEGHLARQVQSRESRVQST